MHHPHNSTARRTTGTTRTTRLTRPVGLAVLALGLTFTAIPMTAQAGVLRSAHGLADTTALLDKLAGMPAGAVDQDAWETTNLLTVATALADAAALRQETRGSHWREDFPDRDDAQWAGHVDVRLGPDGLALAFAPAPASDSAPVAGGVA